MEVMVEICCGSYEDAWNAYQGGAQRIELNSALYLGGLTPTIGSLIMTKKNTNLKVISMVRPRGGGFCYSDKEFENIKQDAILLLEHGSDGLAFGFLNHDQTIDLEKTKEIVTIIKKHNKEAVFHRAFDCVNDPFLAIEQLIELKVDRVLTSGLRQTAFDGQNLIRDLQQKYGDQIEILAGSGINEDNVDEIINNTGIIQIHSSCKEWIKDPTTISKDVDFSYLSFPQQDCYESVSKQKVARLIKRVSKKL